MSALASRQPDPRGDWISVAEAVALSGLSFRRVQSLCAEEWRLRGLARKEAGEWIIHRSAHERLSRFKNSTIRDMEAVAKARADGVPAEHIEQAKLKIKILAEFNAFPFGGDVIGRFPRFVADLFAHAIIPAHGIGTLTRPTLYRWKKEYGDHGISALIPKFKARGRGGRPMGASALEHITSLILSGNGLKVSKARIATIGYANRIGKAHDPAWYVPSLAAVYKTVRDEIPCIARIAASKGVYVARGACIPKVERDFESIAAGDEWVGDERTLDIWARVQTSRGWIAVRPKMTTWMDMRSRVIVGLVVAPHADANTILASLKRGIMQFGKPTLLRTDWGEDYRAATRHPRYRNFDGSRIGSVLEELGIDVKRVAPYLPNAKPIERFFDTFKEISDKSFASFIGGSPGERHEDRAGWVRNNLEKLPTLEAVERVSIEAIDAYHATPHTAPDMFGKSPAEAMQAFRSRAIEQESESVLTHLFRYYIGPKVVRRDGIRHMHRFYGNGDGRLLPLCGQRVLLAVDVDDISTAMVCKLDRTPLFEIECPSLGGGVSLRELKERIKNQRTLLKPFAAQARAARELFNARPAIEHVRDYKAGIEAVHGNRAVKTTAPTSLRIRPALQNAIDSAAPASGDAIEADSNVIRTGTDCEEITVFDMLGGDGSDWRSPSIAPSGDEEPSHDFFGIDADPLEELP